MTPSTVLDLVRAYANAHNQPADLIDRVLTEVSDEKSIPLRVYGGDLNSLGDPRLVCDPTRVALTNFMGTRGRAVEFGGGTTGIFGGNGVGKSSIQRAVLYAIGGAPAAGVRAAEDLITRGAQEMTVRFEFVGGFIERGCSRRVVSRGKDAGQTKVEHSLEVQIAGDKANRAKEAEGLIAGWLGVDASFVRRVSCLEQGNVTAALDEQPAKRREMFYRMLSLEPCEGTRKSLAEALQEQEDFAVRQARNAETLKGEAEALRRQRAQYNVESLTEKRALVAPLAAGAASSPAQIMALREQLNRRNMDLVVTRKAAADRQRYTQKLDETKRQPELAMVFEDSALATAQSEHLVNTSVNATAAARAALDQITAQGLKIKGLPPVCPTCAIMGRTCDVTPDTKAKLLADLRAPWTAASKALAAAEIELAARKDALQAARAQQAATIKAQATKRFLEEQVQLLQQQIDALPVQINAEAIEADVAKLAQQLTEMQRADSGQAATDLRLIDQALADARALDAQIAALEKRQAVPASTKQLPNEELEALRWAVKAFAKDGIPLWLARQHVGRVNDIARELKGLDRYSYSFGQDLEVVVHDGDGDVMVDLTCGSARQRGAVILMAALGRYLQELSSLQIPFLWIDELPFQDESSSALVVDTIKKLVQWYPKVIFAASRWDDFTGQFDHEISILPEQVSIELDRQREATSKLKAEGQGILAPPPAPVTTYDQRLTSLAAEMTREPGDPVPPVTYGPKLKDALAPDAPPTGYATKMAAAQKVMNEQVKLTEEKYGASPTDAAVRALKEADAMRASVVDQMANHGGPVADPYKAKADEIVRRLTEEAAAKKAAAAEPAAPTMDADLEDDCPF